MSDPCTKEQVLTTLQVKQAEIAGDVAHIKARIDNGMSKTIADIHERLVALEPMIRHHSDIVGRVEDFGWLISRYLTVGLLSVIFGMIVWAIGKGYLPKV